VPVLAWGIPNSVIVNGADVTPVTSKNDTTLPCPTIILLLTVLAGIIVLLAVATVYATPYGLYRAVALLIANAELAVNVRLVLLAIAFTIPAVLPDVLPIQAPMFNCDKKAVPEPVTVALLVAAVTVPVNATLGKLVVYWIGLLVVAICTLSVAMLPDVATAELAVYAYDAILLFLYILSSYNLPTAISIIPSTPSKSAKAFPIIVPILGLCVGLA